MKFIKTALVINVKIGLSIVISFFDFLLYHVAFQTTVIVFLMRAKEHRIIKANKVSTIAEIIVN